MVNNGIGSQPGQRNLEPSPKVNNNFGNWANSKTTLVKAPFLPFLPPSQFPFLIKSPFPPINQFLPFVPNPEFLNKKAKD